MKKALTAAITAALVPTAAMAEDGNQIDAFGSIAAGYNSFQAGDASYSQYLNGTLVDSGSQDLTGKADGLDLEARFTGAVPLSGKYAVQVDGLLGRTNLSTNECQGECPTIRLNETTIAAHVYRRSADKNLIGLIFQRTALTSSYGYLGLPTTYYVGGEGQYYAGKVTAYGKIAYAFGDEGRYYDNFKRDGLNTDFQIRFYPQENLMVALKGGYEETNARYSYENLSRYNFKFKTWSIGPKFEYKLKSSNFSLISDFKYSDTTTTGREYGYIGQDTMSEVSRINYSAIRMLIGVKLNFGTSTLKARDRSGASLDPFRTFILQTAYSGVPVG